MSHPEFWDVDCLIDVVVISENQASPYRGHA